MNKAKPVFDEITVYNADISVVARATSRRLNRLAVKAAEWVALPPPDAIVIDDPSGKRGVSVGARPLHITPGFVAMTDAEIIVAGAREMLRTERGEPGRRTLMTVFALAAVGAITGGITLRKKVISTVGFARSNEILAGSSALITTAGAIAATAAYVRRVRPGQIDKAVAEATGQPRVLERALTKLGTLPEERRAQLARMPETKGSGRRLS